MTLRIAEQDILADRDEAKRQWKRLEQEANHWRDLYNTYNELARLTSGRETPNDAAQPVSSNGHKGTNYPATVRDLVIQVIKKNNGTGLTPQEVRSNVLSLKSDVKNQYIYNLLTALAKGGAIVKQDGKYYAK